MFIVLNHVDNQRKKNSHDLKNMKFLHFLLSKLQMLSYKLVFCVCKHLPKLGKIVVRFLQSFEVITKILLSVFTVNVIIRLMR
jgi:hypothetical protein